MTDTFRALCAELLDVIDSLPFETNYRNESRCVFSIDEDVVFRARAALAQPEPEGLTDEELLRCYGIAKRDHCYEGPMDDWPKRAERAATVCGLRAVIAVDRARWGRPAIEPVSVAERPWEREGWCDADGRCWWGRPSEELCNSDWFLATRAEVEEFCDCSPPVVSLPHHALPVPTPANKET